jgi:uncharacterized glyoxalase superfamily metalloenzyme YdcJ
MKEALVSADFIRTLFSVALSDMYQSEAPQYKALTELVAAVNQRALAENPELANKLVGDERDRLADARHGAIRVGTAKELSTLRRLFAVMGMTPVGYYDLSSAGLPVHSTAFRPVADASLRANPFRIFTSLLRFELITDDELRREAAAILARRDIFTPRCLELLDLHDACGGFDEATAREFVLEALDTFRWRQEAAVSLEVYHRLYVAHPLIADIVCFEGTHINHLTLPTLDIDAVQRALAAKNMGPKAIVEGPPPRRCPILLRQTSYRALPEPISFKERDGSFVRAAHTARFGEIEQRGAALKAKGRGLYDELLGATLAAAPLASGGANADAYQQELARRFSAFPDDYAALRRDQLAFFRYRATEKGLSRAGDLSSATIDDLLQQGHVEIEPIRYEDFLPASAAGIFRSNLGDEKEASFENRSNQAALEAALGTTIVNELALYEAEEASSLAACLEALGRTHEPYGSRRIMG